MSDYEVPVEVKRLRRRERILYYTNKVRREAPAYELLETLDSFLTLGQLRTKTRDLKALIREIEERIKLLESNHFVQLNSRLLCQARRINFLRKRRMSLLLKRLRKRTYDLDNEIQSVKDKEEVAIDVALDTELEIVDICDSVQVDPLPYLLVHKVVGESYVVVEKENQD